MQLVGETITTEQTGAATATVSFHDKTNIPAAPGSYRGLSLTKTETRQQDDGSYITTVTYEGRDSDLSGTAGAGGGGGGGGGGGIEQGGGGGGGGSTYAQREKAVYEWSPSFEQTDIAKHPRISSLLVRYQGTVDSSTGAVVWPEVLAAAGNGGLDGEQGGTNPMFGVTSFLSLGGVWSETRFEDNLPDDAFRSGVFTDVPKGGPPTPGGRFWLSMPPIVASHGKGFKVTRRWMLSGFASDRDIEAATAIYGSA